MGFDDGRRLKGVYAAEVLHNKQVTPHMVRLTLGGDDLRRFPQRGFDQWFRLFLPRPWARTAQPGERVVLMDQGTGFDFAPDASFHLSAGRSDLSR